MGDYFREILQRVQSWGIARGIVPNGIPEGQAKKTVEEANELLDAIRAGDDGLAKDAVGDTLVTLVMVCSIKGWDIVDCFEQAYEEIKDRRGQMGTDGIFYRVGQTMPDGTVVE